MKRCVLLLSLVPVFAHGVTTTLEYEDSREAASRAAISNEITTAVGAVPVAGNYAAVSNAAMSAIQSHQPLTNFYTRAETESKIVELAPAPGNYATVSNRAMTALQSHQSLAGKIDVINGWSRYLSLNDATVWEGLSFTSALPGHKVWTMHPGRISTPDGDIEIPSASGTFALTSQIPSGGVNPEDLVAATNDLARTIPNNITRSATDATLVHCDDGTCTNALVYIRQASSSLAGLMTAADKNRLDGMSGLPSDVATLGSQVASIGAHLNAEDAHFVSTNYDSAVHLPEAYVEIKMRDEATGSNTWITIWQEMRRWGAFVGSAFDWQTWNGFHAWMTNVTHELSFKADRCWGIYDSETGGYSPEGYTQISSSNILIAAGMAYQRTVTTDGAVWVLQCNQGVAHVGGDTNGFFRIVDGDGNTQFEIIKGDKREMGADATGITVDNSTTPPTVTIPYSVEAGEHPTLQICDDLATANWKAETDADCLATVSWSGMSGAYVATVRRKTNGNALFVKATFMAGGETYIRNVAPVGMDSIMLNGTRYYLGTATISGHTVLTLSLTPPTP